MGYVRGHEQLCVDLLAALGVTGKVRKFTIVGEMNEPVVVRVEHVGDVKDEAASISAAKALAPHVEVVIEAV